MCWDDAAPSGVCINWIITDTWLDWKYSFIFCRFLKVSPIHCQNVGLLLAMDTSVLPSTPSPSLVHILWADHPPVGPEDVLEPRDAQRDQEAGVGLVALLRQLDLAGRGREALLL